MPSLVTIDRASVQPVAFEPPSRPSVEWPAGRAAKKLSLVEVWIDLESGDGPGTTNLSQLW